MREVVSSVADTDPLEDSDLLTEIVRAMVEIPEAVKVSEKRTGESEWTFWIDVAPVDRGKVIGKMGRTISSIRNIFCSIGALEGKRIVVMVAEPGKTFTHPPREDNRRTARPRRPEVLVRKRSLDSEGNEPTEKAVGDE